MAGELFLRRCYSTQGAGGSHNSHPELGLLLFVAVSVISSPIPAFFFVRVSSFLLGLISLKAKESVTDTNN